MATPNFHRLVNDVRAWSNRDADVLPDDVIEDAISFTADDSYHRLMIPPLEYTYPYTLTDSDMQDDDARLGLRTFNIPVPADLVQFIHLRKTGDTGYILNEKTDVRTFHDMTADTYSDFGFWTRQGNNIKAAGYLNSGDEMEIFYYRRLPATNAVYAVTQDNVTAGVVSHSTTQPVYPDDYPIASLRGEDDPDATAVSADNTIEIDGETPTSGWWVPEEIPHWLKDENRKIVLFGSLAYVGKYLMDDMIVQYHERQYVQEIEAVNNEEKVRKASGGNVQMHFNGRGLI